MMRYLKAHVMRSRLWWPETIVGVLVMVLGQGCADTITTPGPLDPHYLYWDLRLNHHAITIATSQPYDTIRLTATPRSATGDVLSSGDDVRFTVNDTAVVLTRIDANTVRIEAHSPSSKVKVLASLTVDGITLKDSAFVNVNPSGDSMPTPFRLEIVPGGARELVGYCQTTVGTTTLTPRILDGRDTVVSAVVFSFLSSDPDIARVDRTTGVVTITSPSCNQSVLIHVEATAYGVSFSDSVRFVVGPLLFKEIVAYDGTGAAGPIGKKYFYPQTLTIQAGIPVIWRFLGWEHAVPVNVEFEDPSAAVALDTAICAPGQRGGGGFFCSAPWNNVILPGEQGNIPEFTPRLCLFGCDPAIYAANNRARRFMKPGTYRYYSRSFQSGGTILVTP